MLDLTKKVLPSAITVGGRQYQIKTDFRQWLRFAQIVRGKALLGDFDYLYEFDQDTMAPAVPEDRQAGVVELVHFYSSSSALPRAEESGGPELLDFVQDADLIYAAFLQQYGIDLITQDMHWYVFRALMAGLRETRLTDVMGYRSYTGTDKLYQRMRRMWELETPMTEQDKKELEAFDALF